MKRKLLTMLLCVMTLGAWAATETNPTAVVNLVNRVCGTGASDHFTFTLDDTFNGGAEAFQLGTADGKVTVTANTMSALTCGLNWYLNHEAHVNIAWNNLTQTVTSFPVPSDTQLHASDGSYRYYLNYCTFSYSMSFWDEDRWMKEIDWMALHGVNISLQIVGVDALWYKMLTQDYNFTHDQASAWIAGPVHQAWWLMDNLSGMGGPNPAEWYTRQAALGRKIVARMVELGIEPAIPGFIGMVPTSIAGNNPYTGTWTSGINCPVVINATETTVFDGIAKNYYKRLKEIFNYSPKYYANDVMHERGNATGSEANYKAVCDNTRKGMEDYATYDGGEKPTWIAQMWQDNAQQFRINSLSDDHTLLLDLSSERTTYKGSYGSKEYLFCMLHNYGGNIGMYGCMQKMLDEYRSHKQTGTANGSNGTLKGVGATPEGIETNPVLYDLLFELPWLSTDPSADQWLADYTISRYGTDNANAKAAWENLRTTVYANTNSDQQGCREPVFCARPNLSGNNASAWAGASYHWDKSEVIEAAYELLSLGTATNAVNYDYDVVDFARQALTDYAHTLQMDMAGSTPYTGTRFATQSDGFLQLMRDIDELLGTVEDFRLGRWVGAARKIAETEVPSMSAPSGHTSAADWLEWNARLLLTTWHDTNSSGANGLMEYANREYQGLITCYYLPRWEYYFQNLKGGGNGPTSANLYNKVEKAFVYGQTNDANQYTAVPYGTYTAGQATGNAVATAQAMMQKYFGKLSNGEYYSPYITKNVSAGPGAITVDGTLTSANVLDKLNTVFTTKTTGSSIASYCFDLDVDGSFAGETEYTTGVPNCPTQETKCRITTTDGAQIIVKVNVGDQVAPTTFQYEGWTYTCTNIGTSLTLTGATKTTGSNNVTLPTTVEYNGVTYRVTALAPGFMAGNTDITSVTLPSTLTRVSQQQFVPTETKTDNGQKFAFTPNLGSDPWELTVKMHVGNHKKANKNALFIMALMTGDNNIYNAYNPGFQFWHDWSDNKKTLAFTGDGISATLDPNGDNTGIGNSDATITISYADGQLTLHITNSNGGDITRTFAYTMPSDGLNNLTIESVANPATDTDTYITSVSYTIPSKLAQKLVGDGTTKTVNPPFTLKNDKNWTITARFQTTGAAYNQYGSGLFATGTNALATTYSGGFQYYLKKNGTIVYKINAGSDTHTSSFAVANSEDAYLTIDHVANGATTFRLDQGSNHDIYTTADNVVFNDITVLSSAIPAGITIEDIVFDMDGVESSPIFEGCTSLTAINVATGNCYFASEGGILYDINKMTLKRVPEAVTGELVTPNTLKRVASNAFANSSATMPVNLDNASMLSAVPVANTALVINTSDNNATALAAVNGATFPNVKVIRTQPAADAWDALMLPFAWSASDINRTVKAATGITVADSKVTLNFAEATTLEAGKVYFLAPDSPAASARAQAPRKAAAGTEELEFTNKTINSTVTPQVFTEDGVTATITGSYDAQTAASGDYILSDTYLSAASGAIAAGVPVLKVTGATPANVLIEGEPDPEPVVSKWTLVEASGDRASEKTNGTLNAELQYLRKIMLNGTTVHTASTGEGIAVNTVVPTEVSVQAGKILKVQFVGNASNMRFTYMTAYLDYNSDGDFLDAGECIGTLGSKGAQDVRLEGSEANPVTFYIRIPNDATLGETNLRLRFDGAWMSIDGPANSTTDVLTGNATTPMLPQSATNRNAYDIHLNIVANDGLPIFSTVDNPFWYMLKGNGSNFVGDVGANEKLQVCSRDDIAPEELWQFIGDNKAGFKMRNAAGRYVGYVTENNVKLCVATTEDNATLFTYSGAMNNCQFPMKENSSLKFRIQGTGVGNIVDIINADGAYTKFAIIEPTPVNLPSFYSANTAVADRTWYNVNLNGGSELSIAQNGEGAQLAIKTKDSDDHEQVWSLIGTDHTNFKMVNGNGRYVGWDGTNFVDTDADNAVSLRLRASYTSDAIDGLAIQRIGSSNWNCVNATSASTDAQLHEGGKDAANSKFSFAEAPTPRQFPTFSTVTNPVYYQVEFARNNKHHVLSQPTSGNKLVTANSDSKDTKQMWQLIGSKSNFKLRAINGNYVGFSGGCFTTVANEADAVSLCLVVHGDSNFEIRRVAEGVTNGMNMTGYAGGDEVGQELGEWNYMDVNNELNFVLHTRAGAPALNTPYLVQFQNGYKINNSNTDIAHLCLTDVGKGNVAKALYRFDAGLEQQWMLEGETLYQFKLKNAAGRYLYADIDQQTGNVSFKTSDTDSDDDTYKFRLDFVDDTWQIHCLAADQDVNLCQFANQPGSDVIGFASAEGDNALSFVTPSNLQQPVFSTSVNSATFHRVKFTGGNNYLSFADDDNLKTAAKAQKDAKQHFALIGTWYDFQLYAKTRDYADHNGSDRGDALFHVSADGATHYRLASKDGSTVEIQRIGSNECFNQKGGTDPGNPICEWYFGAAGNLLTFEVAEVTTLEEDDLTLATTIRDAYNALPADLKGDGVVGNYNAAGYIQDLEAAITHSNYSALPALLDAIGRTPNQFTNGKLYVIKNAGTGGWLQNDDTTPNTSTQTGEGFQDDTKFQWLVYTDNQQTVLYNVEAQGVLNRTTDAWQLPTSTPLANAELKLVPDADKGYIYSIYKHITDADYYLHDVAGLTNNSPYGDKNLPSGWMFKEIRSASDTEILGMNQCLGIRQYILPQITQSKAVTSLQAGKRYYIAAQIYDSATGTWSEMYLRKATNGNRTTQSTTLDANCIWTCKSYDNGLALQRADGAWMGDCAYVTSPRKLTVKPSQYRVEGVNTADMVMLQQTASAVWIPARKVENANIQDGDRYTGTSNTSIVTTVPLDHSTYTLLYKLYEVDNYDNTAPANSNLHPYRIKFTNGGVDRYITVTDLSANKDEHGTLGTTTSYDDTQLAYNSTVWTLHGNSLDNFMLRSSARRYIAYEDGHFVTKNKMEHATHFCIDASNVEYMTIKPIVNGGTSVAMHVDSNGKISQKTPGDPVDEGFRVEFKPFNLNKRSFTVAYSGLLEDGVTSTSLPAGVTPTVTVDGEHVSGSGNSYTVSGDAMLHLNVPTGYKLDKWTRSYGGTEVYIPGDADVMVTPWTNDITYTAYLVQSNAYPWNDVEAADNRKTDAVVGALYVNDLFTPAWKQEKGEGENTQIDVTTANAVHTVVTGYITGKDNQPCNAQVKAGSNLVVRWISNQNLKDMRLTAYIDNNHDGEFEQVTSSYNGDCLGYMGRTGDQQPEYMYGTADMLAGFNITLPIDIEEGTTTLRLRFDRHDHMLNQAKRVPFLISSETSNHTDYAVDPEDATSGMVFDVRLDVLPADVWSPIRVMDRSATQNLGSFSALERSKYGYATKIDEDYHKEHLYLPEGETTFAAGETYFCKPGQIGESTTVGQHKYLSDNGWDHWYVNEGDTDNPKWMHYHMYSIKGRIKLVATPKTFTENGETKKPRCLGWWRRVYDRHPAGDIKNVSFVETRLTQEDTVWVEPSAKAKPYYIEYYTKFAYNIPVYSGDQEVPGFIATPNGDEVTIDGTSYTGVTVSGSGKTFTGTEFTLDTYEYNGGYYVITEVDKRFLSENNTVTRVNIGKHVKSVGETYNSYVPYAYYVNNQPLGDGSGSGDNITPETFNGSTHYFEVYNIEDKIGHPHPDHPGVTMRMPYVQGTLTPIGQDFEGGLKAAREEYLTELSNLGVGDPQYRLTDEGGIWNVRMFFRIPDTYKVGETDYKVQCVDTPAEVQITKAADGTPAETNNWSFSSHNHFALLGTGPDTYDSYNEFCVVLPRKDYIESLPADKKQNPYLQVQTNVSKGNTGQVISEERTYYFRKLPLASGTKRPVEEYANIDVIHNDQNVSNEPVTLADLLGRDVELEMQYRLGGRIKLTLYTDAGMRAAVDIDTEGHELRDLMRLCSSLPSGAGIEHISLDYIEPLVDFTRVRETYKPKPVKDYQGDPDNPDNPNVPNYATQNWLRPDNLLGDKFRFNITTQQAEMTDADFDTWARSYFHLESDQDWRRGTHTEKVNNVDQTVNHVTLQMNNKVTNTQMMDTDVFTPNNRFYTLSNGQEAVFTADYDSQAYNDRYAVINMLGDPDAEPIPIDMNWTFECIYYPVKDRAFNTHGSVILGTGTNGSKNNWPNGFQFYFTYLTEGSTRGKGREVEVDGKTLHDSQGFVTLKINSGQNVPFTNCHPANPGEDTGSNDYYKRFQYNFEDSEPISIQVKHDGDNPELTRDKFDNILDAKYKTYFLAKQGSRILLEYTSWEPIHTIREFCTNVPAAFDPDDDGYVAMQNVILHGWSDDRTVPVIAGLAMQEYKVDPDNKFFSSHKGALFDKHAHLLLQMPLAKDDGITSRPRTQIVGAEDGCNCGSQHFTEAEGNVEKHISLSEVSRKAFQGWKQADGTIPKAKCLLAADMFQYGYLEALNAENTALQLKQDVKYTEQEILDRIKFIGTTYEFGRVEIDRPLEEGHMNMVSMPFNVSAAEVMSNYGGYAYRLHAIRKVTDNLCVVTLKRVDEMRAGEAYLVKPVSGINLDATDKVIISHTNRQLRTYSPQERKTELTQSLYTEYSGETTGVEMTGNYASTTVPMGVYFYHSATDKFYRYTYDRVTNMKGFRGTLALTTTDAAGVRRIDLKRSLSFSMLDDDEPDTPTEIDDVPMEVVFEAEPVNVYDLNGNLIRRDCTDLDPLHGLPRGIYIVGGKKIVKN